MRCPRCDRKLGDVTTAEDVASKVRRGYCLTCRQGFVFGQVGCDLIWEGDLIRRPVVIPGISFVAGRTRPWRAHPNDADLARRRRAKGARVHLGYFETRAEAEQAVCNWRERKAGNSGQTKGTREQRRT